MESTVSVSQKFDSVYKEVIKLLDGDDDDAITDKAKDTKINSVIQDLEQLTVTVSRLSLFSKSESYDELSAETLKFLLLPYLLGSCWQIKKIEPNSDQNQQQNTGNSDASVISFRKNICEVSKVYFQDFIQRCLEYKIVEVEPPVFKLINTFHDDEAKNEDLGSGDVEIFKKQADLISKYFDSGDRRQLKVKHFKEKKELDQKINKLEEKRNAGEDLDEEIVQELYLAVLRRAVPDSSSQLETIIQELNLIKYQGNDTGRKIVGQAKASEKTSKNPYGIPFKTFILTKTEIQKKVYGMGYPALPILTVEELYEQRVAEGIWPGGPAPPSAAGATGDQQELDDKFDELQMEEEAADDPEYLARQRNMDEYKDSHRRGWGNRMNRS